MLKAFTDGLRMYNTTSSTVDSHDVLSNPIIQMTQMHGVKMSENDVDTA